tara:strand:- start:1044 stop:2057 length:1014 start_codon:yes stop_codon:yes gene_type:complete
MANITQTLPHRRENDFHTLYSLTSPAFYIRFGVVYVNTDLFYDYQVIFDSQTVYDGETFSPHDVTRNSNKAATPSGGVGSYANAPGWPANMVTSTGGSWETFGRGAIENTYLGICDKITTISGTNYSGSKCHAYIGTFQAVENEYADEFAYVDGYYYSLKIAGPPPQASKTIRFDEDYFENSLQRNSSDTSQSFMKYRFTIYDSDAYFQGVTSSTAGFFGYGSYNPQTSPTHLGPVLKTRHESGNNEQMRDADRIRLVVNNTGTIKYKFARYNSGDNYRILFYLNGSGNATIIQNNSNNSEQTSTVTLSAGTYTVCWQKGSGAPNASCRVMICGEDP